MPGSTIQRQFPSHESTRLHPQPEIHQHNHHKTDTNDSGTPFLVVNSLDIAALADLVHAPDIQQQGVDQRTGGQEGKGPRTRQRDRVDAKVEKGGGDTAQDDREFQPGEESAFRSKVDFGFDTDRDENS